jgi:hypothetical protein
MVARRPEGVEDTSAFGAIRLKNPLPFRESMRAIDPRAVIRRARIPQCSITRELLSFRLVRRALSRCSLAAAGA